jgi:hypothetical protein
MDKQKQMNNLLISDEVINIVREKYNVIDIVDLVKYSLYPEQLAEKLAKYFSYTFTANDRIVILHHDTDYYPSTASVGNTVYNFFRLCANFDISIENIIFFTNHYGIEKEITFLANTICNSDSISIVYTSLWYDFPSDEDIDQISVNSNSAEFEWLYSCLNGQQREHRIFTLCMLAQYELLDSGIVSYHFKN